VLLKVTLSIMTEADKKRKDLSLQEKQKILECYEKVAQNESENCGWAFKNFTTTFM
jgi:hypothetical protein